MSKNRYLDSEPTFSKSSESEKPKAPKDDGAATTGTGSRNPRRHHHDTAGAPSSQNEGKAPLSPEKRRQSESLLTTEENAATSSDANSPEEDHRKEKEDIKEKKEEERKGERISIDSSEDSMPVLMHPIVSQKLSKDKDKDKERKDDRDSDPSKKKSPKVKDKDKDKDAKEPKDKDKEKNKDKDGEKDKDSKKKADKDRKVKITGKSAKKDHRPGSTTISGRSVSTASPKETRLLESQGAPLPAPFAQLSNSTMNELLVLSSLNLSVPHWELLAASDPEALYYYVPLFLGVHQTEPPREFFEALKPALHHKYDVSIRQLLFLMSRVGILPEAGVRYLAGGDDDQKALVDVFEKFEAAAPAPDTVLDDAGLADPLFGVPSTVKTLKVLKVFKSAARPFLCEIDFEDSLLSPRRFIFKKGDDMRGDMYTMSMFYLFNRLWEHANMTLTPYVRLYRVLPFKKDSGFIEFVPAWTVESYDWTKLDAFSLEDKRRFVLSAAGSFVAAFILGVRDRHRDKDNMMISEEGEFFHIDFGYLFNTKTWFDGNRFAIPREMRQRLPEYMEQFMTTVGEAFRILRRNRGMISYFITRLFRDLFPEDQITKCLNGAFYDRLSEDKAVAHVIEIALKGEASPKKAIKDLVHSIESKKK